MDQTTLTLIESANYTNNVYDSSLWSIQYNSTGQNFNKVVYAAPLGIWVGVGDAGHIAVSRDSTNWEILNIQTTNGLNSVEFANNTFVAVGNSGAVFTSINGYDWIQRTSPYTGSGLTQNFTEVSFGNNTWTAYAFATSAALLMTSTDTITWTAKYLFNFSDGFLSASEQVTNSYNNGLWVTIRGGLPYTSTDGITWTCRIPLDWDGIVRFYSVYYYNNRWFLISNNHLALSSDGITWTYIRLTTGTTYLNKPAYQASNNKLLLPAGATQILISNDLGNSWTLYPGTNRSNASVDIFGNGVWVCAANTGGVISSSSDGITWTQRATSAISSYAGLYANGLFVLVGLGGAIRTSPDGIAWATPVSSTTSALYGIFYGNGVFVAVGSGGVIRYSATGTGTWSSPTTLAHSFDNYTIRYANGVWITAGNNLSIATSTDAITWTLRQSSATLGWGGGRANTRIVYDSTNNVWIVTGGDATFRSVDNGTTWTTVYRGVVSPRYLGFGNNTWTTVGNSGEVATSTDLLNWTFRNSGTTNQLNRVKYKNNTWVAVGNTGTIITSSDANTWTSRTSGSTSAFLDLDYDASTNTWSVCGNTTSTVRTSTDLATWTARTSPTSANLNGISSNNAGRWAVAGNWGLMLGSTDNAVTWNRRTSIVTSNPLAALYSVDYGAGLFVAVGNGGLIITSPDGITWTTRTSGTAQLLFKVAFANNTFVAVGNGGAITTSTNGTSWTARTSGVATTLTDVAFGNNLWVAVGVSGVIRTSPGTDLVTWSGATSGTTTTLNCVAYGGGMWVIGNNISTTTPNIRYSATGTGIWTAGPYIGTPVSDIDYINGRFITASFFPYTSTNGTTWDYAGSGNNLSSIDYTFSWAGSNFLKTVNNKMIAAKVTTGGVTSAIYISKNGLDWNPSQEHKLKNYSINDIAYGNGKYVVTGRLGTSTGFIGVSTV